MMYVKVFRTGEYADLEGEVAYVKRRRHGVRIKSTDGSVTDIPWHNVSRLVVAPVGGVPLPTNERQTLPA